LEKKSLIAALKRCAIQNQPRFTAAQIRCNIEFFPQSVTRGFSKEQT
jgi:hypothetical protein